MPKVDPITGCTVMTLPEYLHSEAKYEGKGRTGADLMNDMYQEMEDDERREEREYRNDKAKTMDLFCRVITAWNRDCDPEERLLKPTRIKRIIEVEVRQGMRSGETLIKALCIRADGKRGVLTYEQWHSSGSFYEPPDGEENISWSRVRKA